MRGLVSCGRRSRGPSIQFCVRKVTPAPNIFLLLCAYQMLEVDWCVLQGLWGIRGTLMPGVLHACTGPCLMLVSAIGPGGPTADESHPASSYSRRREPYTL